jgi:hypothetical protein
VHGAGQQEVIELARHVDAVTTELESLMMSDSSLFSSIFASDALSVLSTLPWSGRMAWIDEIADRFADSRAQAFVGRQPADLQFLGVSNPRSGWRRTC